MCVPVLYYVRFFVTLWTVAHWAPLSMGFPRQECWSGLPFPPSGDLPDPGIEHVFPALAGRFFITEPPGKPLVQCRSPQMLVPFGGKSEIEIVLWEWSGGVLPQDHPWVSASLEDSQDSAESHI